MPTESVWSWSTTAASNNTIDSGISWSEGQTPGSVNNSARGMMAAIAKFRNDTGGSLSLAGGTTAYTLTTNQVLASLANGVMLSAKCNATNTGASTLAVDGLTAKAIRKHNSITGELALSAGDMVSGAHYNFQYNTALNGAAGAWVLLNPASTPGGGGYGTAVVFADSPYTIPSSRSLVPVDCTNGAVTVTLPSAVTVGDGHEITIIKADPTVNFVTINSASSQLIGYPGTTYSFHGTAGTAVSNNGGFVRIQMSAENRVFMTGDKVRISGVVGFAALNADHTITRPSSASGRSFDSLDTTVAFAAGYTSGGTVAWIQTSCQLRVCNGSVTLKSNGTHWVYKHATPDVWTGPKDNLAGQRNIRYSDIATTISGSALKGGLDAMTGAHNLRPTYKSLALGEDGDPVDVKLGRYNKDYLSSAVATSLTANTSMGVIYGQGSDQNGSCQAQSGSIAFVTAEVITTAGHGAGVRCGTTPLGAGESQTTWEARENGKMWLGAGFERGTILADPGRAIPATGVLTAAANPADGDTVTIDTVVYTFESGSLDASSPTAVEVLLGASASDSLDNLIAAVNATGTAGTHYGTGTTRHTTVYAMAGTGDTVDLVAQTGGTAGNSIVTTETGANLSFASGTLTGGAAENISHLGVAGDSTGATVTLRADAIIGGISNITMQYRTKGAGTHKFFSDGGTTVQQFEVLRTASASRWITVAGSNGGNPTISASAGMVAFGVCPVVPSLTVAEANALTDTAGAVALITNETGGAVLAFNEGTDWRRVTDRAVIA